MRLKAFLILAALGAGLALASCETMSVEECAAADWRALGFNDAASGGTDNFANRAQSCGEKGIVADGAAYQQGQQDGLVQFCQPPNAFSFGRRGGSFNGSCRPDLQGNFYAAYNDGRRVYEAENEFNTTQSNVNSYRSRLDDIRDRMDRSERALREATTDDERNRIRNDLDSLRRDRREVQDNLRDAEPRLYYLQRRVDDLRYEIGNRWAPW